MDRLEENQYKSFQESIRIFAIFLFIKREQTSQTLKNEEYKKIFQ